MKNAMNVLGQTGVQSILIHYRQYQVSVDRTEITTQIWNWEGPALFKHIHLKCKFTTVCKVSKLEIRFRKTM